MLKTMSNNAILTKSRAMFGKRLTESDYNELMRKQSVPELAQYLRDNTHYEQVIGKIDVQSIRRGQLESLLRRSMFERYIKLIRYDSSGSEGFYHYIVVRSEIDQLLTAIRLLNSGSMQDYYFTMPAFLEKYARFDLASLGGANSYEQLLSVVKRTDYYKIMERYRPLEGQPVNIAACEAALLTYYFRHVFSAINKEFSGPGKKELEELFLMQIDIHNFAVAFRLRRYFNSPPQEVKACLLPFETQSKKTIAAIVNATSKEQIMEIVAKSKYGKDQKIDDLEYVESLVERTRYRRSLKDMRFSTNPSVVLTSFMLLCTEELNNIVNIVEGIRYGLDTADIKNLLIL